MSVISGSPVQVIFNTGGLKHCLIITEIIFPTFKTGLACKILLWIFQISMKACRYHTAKWQSVAVISSAQELPQECYG